MTDDTPTLAALAEAYQAAIEATREAENAHDTALDLDGNTHRTGDELDEAIWLEVRAGRAFFAAWRVEQEKEIGR